MNDSPRGIYKSINTTRVLAAASAKRFALKMRVPGHYATFMRGTVCHIGGPLNCFTCDKRSSETEKLSTHHRIIILHFVVVAAVLGQGQPPPPTAEYWLSIHCQFGLAAKWLHKQHLIHCCSILARWTNSIRVIVFLVDEHLLLMMMMAIKVDAWRSAQLIRQKKKPFQWDQLWELQEREEDWDLILFRRKNDQSSPIKSILIF